MSTGDGGSESKQDTRSPNGKAVGAPRVGGDGGGSASASSSGDADGDNRGEVRPPCGAEGCERRSRPDSRFCSDACGVFDAEKLLSKALRHSLEERGGNERGRFILEMKEYKRRKQEVGHDDIHQS